MQNGGDSEAPPQHSSKIGVFRSTVDVRGGGGGGWSSGVGREVGGAALAPRVQVGENLRLIIGLGPRLGS